ncbi:MAG: threonine synthase [Clostridia bacterium]|jgi:threonine synthase|nr:threonine synthase [Clostridia bacterium]
MRLRRIAGTKEKLLDYKNIIIMKPAEKKGLWREYFGNDNKIILEIGCGRGLFITTAAKLYPHNNYIGLELREEMVYDCVRRLGDELPTNLAFLWQEASLLTEIFAQGEVDKIYLNFSDPWPKTKHHKRRLTHPRFLRLYQEILAPDGEINFKTDNEDLFRFSLLQFKDKGFRVSDIDWDYPFQAAFEDVATEYENRYRKQGKPIYRLTAKQPPLEDKEQKKMKYISTRNNYKEVNAAAAIRSGMVPCGGLFVPVEIPAWQGTWQELAEFNYQELAEKILKLYLTDFMPEDIIKIVKESYNEQNFRNPEVAPLVHLTDNKYILELWHGPTAAFKDMALQIMPRLLVQSVAIEGDKKEVDILVATSGDTGKAALEGFKNIDGIKVIVFYPHNGVSRAQYLQMATTDGNNTNVVAVKGNFDNCQTGVKEIFGNADMAKRLALQNKEFSSANSINWGRLLPQIIYYFWAYGQMLKQDALKAGEAMNVVVPTGNFGNILAGYYAKAMGLPIKTMICASNSNKVLTDVLQTGTYDRRRDFVKTTSPSMDILVSSNFERFLFAMSNGDGNMVARCFNDLNTKGIFTVPEEVKANWQKVMVGGYAEEAEVKKTIGDTFKNNGYALDPHTAVAVKVCEDYMHENTDDTPVVIVSTASPYKFGRAVLEAIEGTAPAAEMAEAQVLAHLSEVIKTPVHYALAEVENKPILHKTVVDVSEMPAIVAKILEI